MTRSVFCQKYQTTLPGLEKPPFPGPKGEHIYQQTSAKAWQEWQTHQTRLINEKQLTLTHPDARKYLMLQMEKFLTGQDYDKAEGYIPKEDP